MPEIALARQAGLLQVSAWLFAHAPVPTDHFTAVPMDMGTWIGCFASRPSPDYAYSVEYDSGVLTIPAAQTKQVRGLTFVSPLLAAQSVTNLALTLTVGGRAALGLASMLVRPRIAICKWLANDTQGAVFVDGLNGTSLDTSEIPQDIVHMIPGVTSFQAGDRLAVDLWFSVQNTSGSGAAIRWWFLEFGDAAHELKLACSPALGLFRPIELNGEI